MNVNVIPANELTQPHLELWDRLLLDNSALDNPFFRPEFVRTAARVIPNVEVAVLSADGEDVGFFPFERLKGKTAQPVGGFLSDLHGVIVGQGTTWDADTLIRECDLHCWQFDHLIASQTPFKAHHSFTDDSPYMDLSDGYDEYCRSRTQAGTSVIKRAAAKRRRLERDLGPLCFTAHTTDRAAWNTLTDWKREQLMRQGYADMFQLSWVNELFEELRGVQEERFTPLLSTLHAGDELLAVHLGLKSPTAIDSWIPTYAAEYSKYSPGLLLQLELAQWGSASGVRRVDLGRGENQMKTSLMSDSLKVAVGTIDHRPVHRALTHAYYGIRSLVYASPFRDTSEKVVRKLKTWLF